MNEKDRRVILSALTEKIERLSGEKMKNWQEHEGIAELEKTDTTFIGNVQHALATRTVPAVIAKATEMAIDSLMSLNLKRGKKLMKLEEVQKEIEKEFDEVSDVRYRLRNEPQTVTIEK